MAKTLVVHHQQQRTLYGDKLREKMLHLLCLHFFIIIFFGNKLLIFLDFPMIIYYPLVSFWMPDLTKILIFQPKLLIFNHW